VERRRQYGNRVIVVRTCWPAIVRTDGSENNRPVRRV